MFKRKKIDINNFIDILLPIDIKNTRNNILNSINDVNNELSGIKKVNSQNIELMKNMIEKIGEIKQKKKSLEIFENEYDKIINCKNQLDNENENKIIEYKNKLINELKQLLKSIEYDFA